MSNINLELTIKAHTDFLSDLSYLQQQQLDQLQRIRHAVEFTVQASKDLEEQKLRHFKAFLLCVKAQITQRKKVIQCFQIEQNTEVGPHYQIAQRSYERYEEDQHYLGKKTDYQLQRLGQSVSISVALLDEGTPESENHKKFLDDIEKQTKKRYKEETKKVISPKQRTRQSFEAYEKEQNYLSKQTDEQLRLTKNCVSFSVCALGYSNLEAKNYNSFLEDVKDEIRRRQQKNIKDSKEKSVWGRLTSKIQEWFQYPSSHSERNEKDKAKEL